MTGIIFWLFLFAWITVLLIPLINNVLTPETINTINTMLNNLEYFIGSDNINVFLAMITIILIIVFIRFFVKFFPWHAE